MKKHIFLIASIIGISMLTKAQTWETVGNEGFTAGGVQYACMDVYNGTPYVAFKDLANSSKCTVMRYNGTDWVFVGQEGFTSGIAREQSLAIDQQNGDVYLEYSDADANATVVSKFNDNTNAWEPLGQNGVAATPEDFYQQIKIDNGVPYLVLGGYAAKLKEYTDGTGTWAAIPSPTISFAQAWYTRMSIDAGNQYVIYSDFAHQGKATVAKIDASGVSAVGGTLGFTAGGVGYTDITTENGTPYISFQDSLNGRKISVMQFDGTNWNYIGSPGISGADVKKTRILVHNSVPYISYHDNNDGNIHVKKYDGSAWVSVGSAVANGNLRLSDMIINGNEIFVAYNEFSGAMTVKKFDMNANGLNEIINGVTVSPNPVNTQLTIELTGNEIDKIEIHDFSGKVLRTVIGDANQLNVEELEPGNYWLKLYFENSISRTRFVKQ